MESQTQILSRIYFYYCSSCLFPVKDMLLKFLNKFKDESETSNSFFKLLIVLQNNFSDHWFQYENIALFPIQIIFGNSPYAIIFKVHRCTINPEWNCSWKGYTFENLNRLLMIVHYFPMTMNAVTVLFFKWYLLWIRHFKWTFLIFVWKTVQFLLHGYSDLF